jgi:cytochrome c5
MRILRNISTGLTLVILLLPSSLLAATTQAELGAKIYNDACSKCHAPKLAMALKAPAAFDKAAWKQRLDNAEVMAKKDDRFADGISYLIYQVKIGKGLMHHGGLCLESPNETKNCSDEAYRAAIGYMSGEEPAQ